MLTDTELLALLDRLDHAPADAIESETLEFKPWTDPKSDLKVAVEYAVCFANAQGVVLFGVDDKQVGRTKAIHGAKGYELERWRRDIFDSTSPSLTVEVFELPVRKERASCWASGFLLAIRNPTGLPAACSSNAWARAAWRSTPLLSAGNRSRRLRWTGAVPAPRVSS